MKFIRIETNVSIYNLPLHVVAHNRARYYAEPHTPEYKEEFDFVMEDDYEGIDWIKNNMDYEDYSSKLIFIKRKEEDEDFNNANMDIVE